MIYKAKIVVCSEIRKNTQRKASTMLNCGMLNLMVHQETARL
jgi:hypothetical protein